jgi:hypothetical protein
MWHYIWKHLMAESHLQGNKATAYKMHVQNSDINND